MVKIESMKKIQIIIPSYNEEGNIKEIYSQLLDSFELNKNYQFSILFVENGSSDNTYGEILKLTKDDKKVKMLKLSRNFKMDGAIAAGLESFEGDAAVIMTANLQDDPAVISQFIKKWEEGYEQVYGIVSNGCPVSQKLHIILC